MKKISKFKIGKFKKIIIISVVVLLLLGTLGTFLAFYGRDDFNYVKNKVENAFVKEELTENRNLIYNSDFSINTSGIDVFTQETSTKYGDPLFDGWILNHGNCDNFKLYSTDSGLYLKVDETANLHFDMSHRVMNSSGFLGDTFTMTFSLDGVVYSKTFDLTLANTEYRLSSNHLVATFSKYSSSTSYTYVTVNIQANAGFEGTINWIQLEFGDVFTGYSQGPSTYVNPVIS